MDKNRCMDLRAAIEVLVDHVAFSVGAGSSTGSDDVAVAAEDRSEETEVDDNAAVSNIISLRLLLPKEEDDDDDDDDDPIEEWFSITGKRIVVSFVFILASTRMEALFFSSSH